MSAEWLGAILPRRCEACPSFGVVCSEMLPVEPSSCLDPTLLQEAPYTTQFLRTIIIECGMIPAPVTFLPVLLCTRSALPYLFCARICLWPQWAVYSGKQDWQRIKVRARSRVIVSAVYLDPRPETAWNQRGGKSGASVRNPRVFQKIHPNPLKVLKPAESHRCLSVCFCLKLIFILKPHHCWISSWLICCNFR